VLTRVEIELRSVEGSWYWVCRGGLVSKLYGGVYRDGIGWHYIGSASGETQPPSALNVHNTFAVTSECFHSEATTAARRPYA
jgi:hypothetical protein